MQQLVYSVDEARHAYTAKLVKGSSYPMPEGWAVIFFDANGNSYSPADRFASAEQAQAFLDEGLKDGVYIA